MKFFVEILDSDNKIANNILVALAEEFNNRVSNKLSILKKEVSEQVVNFLSSTNTYKSLIDGDLADHFGLPSWDRQDRIDAILQMIGNNVEIDFKPIKVRGKNFVNEIRIGILIKDFLDILSMSEAIVTTNKGQELPWLEWLLKFGDRIIISQYDIRFKQGRGRSGGAIMIKNDAKAWRVPIEFAGTINNNWLIESLTSKEFNDLLSNIVKGCLDV